MQWLSLISTVLSWILIGALLLGRRWFEAKIEKGVEHKFNEKLENFRADLRNKEAEISALRDGVLSGRAQRQALLDKRRFEAVERVWSAVSALAPLKSVAASMAAINLDFAAKEVPNNPKLRKLFEVFLAPVPNDKIPEDPAKNEQPFVSPLAWAYLSAYRTVVTWAWVRAKLLSIGIEKSGELLDAKNVQKILKAALPHRADYIDKQDPRDYYYLLDELEEKLLGELKRVLEGSDTDEASIRQSVDITKKVKVVEQEWAEQAAAQNANVEPQRGA